MSSIDSEAAPRLKHSGITFLAVFIWKNSVKERR
jgi:hypothetical protein